MHVMITGANGFVGRALCRTFIENGHRVTGIVRCAGTVPAGVEEWVQMASEFADIGAPWPASHGAVDCIVHLAARVHVGKDAVSDVDAAFRATNVEGTLRVAEAAHRHGVRRMVFVSSVKAIAETDGGQPLHEDSLAYPEDPYGRSKREAEISLRQFGDSTGLETVVVRPPLVYGPEVRANFLRMMAAISRGIPLPFGAITARRSVIYIDNLTDALLRCVTDPRAAHGSFHVADDDPPTVAELLRMVGAALGRSAWLFPVPLAVLQLVGRLTGRKTDIERLTGSLQLDTNLIRGVLDWQPPYATRQGLEATAAWYRSRTIRR